ncbi:MAG: RagB/SusD family nutrient uptake outer membrane protein, partial [Bacteroidaceae bacterium]|nr:RagB/SusD family nutrient uptake outer membrane protein [Bacteroidaceae bacterium]
MKLKYSILATIVTLSLTACGDFLEPDSESEFIPKDATSLNELLLGEAYQRNDMDGFNIYLGLLEDDVEAAPYQLPNEGFDGNMYLATYSWQPDMYKMMEEANSGHINIYESYYEVILGANAVLDYIPGIKDSEENINKVKAQAHALRGFYYFNLVNIYGQPYNVAP